MKREHAQLSYLTFKKNKKHGEPVYYSTMKTLFFK